MPVSPTPPHRLGVLASSSGNTPQLGGGRSFTRRPRLSSLLAVVLVLSVLTVPYAPPAAADHGVTTVWSATLTVTELTDDNDLFDFGHGCYSQGSLLEVGKHCKPGAVLTDNDFTSAGVDYVFEGINLDHLQGGDLTLQLIFDKGFPESLKSLLTLNVNDEAFPLADATLGSGLVNNDSVLFRNPGLTWAVGNKVKLSLTRDSRAGDLDHTFGVGGTVRSAFDPIASEVYDIVEQPDGKIVAVGFASNVNAHGNTLVASKDFAIARYNPDGSLDTSFGVGGRVLTNFTVPGSHNGLDDEARAVALQSDGKIVVAGYAAHPHNGNEFVVARYNVDGTLDTGFGTEHSGSRLGFVIHSFSSANDSANAVAIQTVGGTERILLAGQTGNSFGLVRYTANGTLDTGFGAIVNNVLRTGVKTVNFSQGADGVNAVAIGADNKIIAAGFTTNNNGTTTGTDPTADDHKDFALLQLSGVGDEDSTFGTNGKLTTNFGTGSADQINDIAIQSNGKIVAAGYSDDGWVLARYNTGGALDGEFGDLKTGQGQTGRQGRKIGSTGADAVNLNTVAVQPDGKIVAAGYTSDASEEDGSFVVRVSAAGVPESQFATNFENGFLNVTVDDRVRAIALLDGGGIVLGGFFNTGSVNEFALYRTNTDGSKNTAFGFDGKVTTSFGGDANARAMAVQSDGKIVVAGYVTNDNNTPTNAGDDHDDFAVARYNPDGTLDTSFGTRGRVTTDIGTGSDDEAFAVAVDGSGNIVVAGGSSSDGAFSNNDFAVVRYTSAGALDTTFSTDGKTTTDFASGADLANAVTIDGSGKIVAGGYANGADDFNDFALARYNTDGSLDTAFDTDGKATSDIESSGAGITALAVQSDGKIIAAGTANSGSGNVATVARYTTAGALDTAFGDIQSGSTRQGYVLNVIGDLTGGANAVALDGSGRIVTAGSLTNEAGTPDVSADDHDDFAVARYTTAGVLDTSFNSVGYATTDFGAQDNDEAHAVAVDGNGKLVVAGFAENGSDKDFALARYNANGTLDTDFGGGKTTTDFGTAADRAYAVAVDGNGKILAAGLAGNEFALARYLGRRPLSDDATLSGLSVSTSTNGSTFAGAATLSPAFDPATASYSTTLRSSVSHIKVTPAVTDANATVTVNGTATASGSASAAIAVTAGATATVNVVVTAEDGTTTKTYTVSVAVQSGVATLSALSVSTSTDGATFGGTAPLDPVFASGTTSYSADAGADVTHVKVTPTVSHSGASVTVQGAATASGSASAAIGVSIGTTTNVSVVVTAQDDQVSRTYTVAVNVGHVATLAVSPNPVAEGASAQITVTITEAQAAAISIPLVVTAGTAESGDYSAPGSVPIAAGATSGTATLQALQDADGDDETLTVALGSSLPADLNAGSPNSVTVTIDDDEEISTVTLGEPVPDPVREGQTVRVAVRVSPAQPSPMTIPLTYTNVDTESGDYSGPSSVTIGANQSVGFARIRTNHDDDSQDEQFTVEVGSNLPLLATAGTPSQVTVTIDDDEFSSEVTIARIQPNPVIEGDLVYVVLKMDPPRPDALRIPVTVTAETAEPGDYSSLSSVIIPAGQPEGVATFRANHDPDIDDETLTVTIGLALPDLVTPGATVQETLTIEDDDDTIAPRQRPSVYDPEPGDRNLTITWFILDDHSPYASFDIDYRPQGTTAWTTTSASAVLYGGRGSHTIGGLTNGTTYEIRVRARNSAGTGPWSSPNEEGAPADPPAPPTTITAGPAAQYGFTNLDVSWNAVPDATAYHLRYRKSGESAWQKSGALSGNRWSRIHATATLLTGLANGATYEIQVRALTGNSVGAWSATTTGTTNPN